MHGFVARVGTWLAVGSWVAAWGCATAQRSGDDDDDLGAELCANGYDDDDDQLVDCFDPDCADLAACAPLEVCGNGTDDDGDQQIDCRDSDCSWRPECGDTIETNCADARDDEGDGLVDCAEPECAAAPNCRGGRPASVDCGAVCARESERGTAGAGPSCVSQCRCSVDEMLNGDFADDYYGCLLASTCGELADPNACVAEAGDVEPTTRASAVISTCAQREDCAGFPCEMLAMLSDDLLDDIDTCLRGTDCITCIDVSQTCP